MGKIHEKSFEVINTRLNKGIGERFTQKEICDEILEKGGILRVDVGVTIKDYLECLYGIGLLEINPSDEELIFTVAAKSIDEANQIVANRSFEYQFRAKHDDILTM